jgi:hypothetical protein
MGLKGYGLRVNLNQRAEPHRRPAGRGRGRRRFTHRSRRGLPAAVHARRSLQRQLGVQRREFFLRRSHLLRAPLAPPRAVHKVGDLGHRRRVVVVLLATAHHHVWSPAHNLVAAAQAEM